MYKAAFHVDMDDTPVFELTLANITNFCEVVPAGITKLVELQQAGYAYIKP